MRFIVYASFLVLCCALIQSSLADSKRYEHSKDDDDNSVEQPTKYKEKKHKNIKYTNKIDDDDDSDKKHTNFKHIKKPNKFVHSEEEEEPQLFKRKNEKTKPFRKDKVDDDDDITEKIKAKISERQLKSIKKSKHESSEEQTKSNKYINKPKKTSKINDDDDKEDTKYTKKFNIPKPDSDEESDEEEDEEPKKKFRRKIRVRIPDSSEEDSDEDADDRARGTCKDPRKGRKSCFTKEKADESGEDDEKPVHKKKIKYSIKFAHEKQKVSHTEDDNIMKKIHRGENKKYRYENDDDDDSSEENTHPKRLQFLDEDDD